MALFRVLSRPLCLLSFYTRNRTGDAPLPPFEKSPVSQQYPIFVDVRVLTFVFRSGRKYSRNVSRSPPILSSLTAHVSWTLGPSSWSGARLDDECPGSRRSHPGVRGRGGGKPPYLNSVTERSGTTSVPSHAETGDARGRCRYEVVRYRVRDL